MDLRKTTYLAFSQPESDFKYDIDIDNGIQKKENYTMNDIRVYMMFYYSPKPIKLIKNHMIPL